MLRQQRVKRGYEPVTIINRTGFHVKGTIYYASLFCPNKEVAFGPYTEYEGDFRGICLVCGVSLRLCREDGFCKNTKGYTTDVCTSFHRFEVTENVVRRI